MTNYEKLCEAVEIESIDSGCCCKKDDSICIRGYIVDASCPENCTNCEYFERHSMLLPLFTAEKQIELIKLLMNAGCFTGYTYKTEAKQYILSYALKNCHNENFSEALAGLVLQLIEAGELDKDKVRKVLK